jgi:hypothetical protein
MATRRSEEVTVKRKGSLRRVRDRRLSTAIRTAFEHHLRARELEPSLREARGLIAERAREFLGDGRGSVSFMVGGLSLSVTPRYEAVIEEENIMEVRKLLGGRFCRLVRVKRRYLGSSDLLEDALVRRFINLRELSPTFRWGV